MTQYYTQINTYWVILEVKPELQGLPSTLDRIYVRSPLTGAAVPLSTLVSIDSTKVGPLAVNHQSQFRAKLHGEGVTFLENPYRLNDSRAVMIEGPSREAIELVEAEVK